MKLHHPNSLVPKPGLLGKINAASPPRVLSLNSPQLRKHPLISDLLVGKAANPKSKYTASDSPTTTIGYLLLLLSSLLLFIGWIGNWTNGGDGTTTTTPSMMTTTTTPSEPIVGKYGCPFGFQGRLCDRKKIVYESPKFLSHQPKP